MTAQQPPSSHDAAIGWVRVLCVVVFFIFINPKIFVLP